MNSNDVELLAQQALDVARRALLVNLRFMNAAFARLTPLSIPGSTLATDGTYLRYDAEELLRLYSEDKGNVPRAFLHVILHNIFLHPFPGANMNRACWDAACDIVVEGTINDLDVPAARCAHADHQRAPFAQIEANVQRMTAEAVYRYLVDLDLSDEELERIRAPFAYDDHDPWYIIRTVEDDTSSKPAEEVEENRESKPAPAASALGKNGTDLEMPEEAKNAKKNHSSTRGLDLDDIPQKKIKEEARRALGSRFADTVNIDRSKEQWKGAAYEMGVALDSYVKLWGSKGSNLSMNLKSVTREKTDYREFLRKFARMGEHIRINDNEFDYVYYCYGLSLFGNLPLIEPLEHTEEKRIRDFVIAIDTSSSTKDGLVRRFIEKTYSILANETSFAARMNVHIIQCDAAITHVERITSLPELSDYLENLEIKGLGGTDFRPVFDYVDAALERGELDNLAGLIYFTDGQGTFPSKMPSYDTAFVFVEDTAEVAKVPVWAMKVTLEETAIIEED